MIRVVGTWLFSQKSSGGVWEFGGEGSFSLPNHAHNKDSFGGDMGESFEGAITSQIFGCSFFLSLVLSFVNFLKGPKAFNFQEFKGIFFLVKNAISVDRKFSIIASIKDE